MNYHQLSEQLKQHVIAFFNSHANNNFHYHNLSHTEGVVQAAIRMASHYKLSDYDFFVVYAAAWFHDTGYLVDDATQHEKKGAEKATEYLKTQHVDEATIGQVTGCIMATAMPQSPKGLLEEIVCDADMFHLGTDDFSERNKQMRKECEARSNKLINKDMWRNQAIQLLQSHHFFTDYCQSLLNQKKQENLDKLLNKQFKKNKEEETDNQPQTQINNFTGAEPVTEKRRKNESIERPDKGIETMFRVASTNSQRLSDMSDNKAHIMISVNSIIISVIIALVVRKLDATPNIIIPTLILLTGSMIAVIFSVLATRPKIPAGIFTKEEIANKSANLLFFGNFYKMDYEDYYDGMLKVMADREFLYGSLIKDIYSQGKVLGRKYKLLRLSYTIFMFTLIFSILAFAIATTLFV